LLTGNTSTSPTKAIPKRSAPEPLEPDGSGTVVYRWIDMPDRSGFGAYQKSALPYVRVVHDYLT